VSTKTAVRGQLSRDVLVQRGLELADTEGLDGVTIRRLAQDFGVTPMALYWHFRNKDELLAALGDSVLGDPVLATALSDDGGPWDLHLENLLTALVAAFRAHPAIAPLAAERMMMSEAGAELTEQTLALLRGAGFDVDQSARLAHHALLTALMLVTGQPGAENQVSETERNERLAAKMARLNQLPAQRYPNLLASTAAFVDCQDERTYYHDGVELFVLGVRGLHRKVAG
jgi:TetR/AcrR family tetracycline transcriptional repressor